MQYWQPEENIENAQRTQVYMFYGKPSGCVMQFPDNAPSTYAHANGVRLGVFESWETAKRRVEEELKLFDRQMGGFPREPFLKDDQQVRLIALQMAVDVCAGYSQNPSNIIDTAQRFRDYLALDVSNTQGANPKPTHEAYDAACKALGHWRDEARRLAKLAGVEPQQLEK